MATEQKIRELKAVYMDRLSRWIAGACGSPIEELFLWAWLVAVEETGNCNGSTPTTFADINACADEFKIRDLYAVEPNLRLVWVGDMMPSSEGPWIKAVGPRDMARVLLVSQVPHGSYRIDFGVFVRHGDAAHRIAVELDGHQFHDATPERAARDKRRDRSLVEGGWRMLRFTGREIHADPEGCATQVISVVETVAAESARPDGG